MAMKIQAGDLWVVIPHSDVVRYQFFRGLCCLHLQQGTLKHWYPTDHYIMSQHRRP